MLNTLHTNLSTMQAAAKQLEFISSNVANINTVGFKGGMTKFESLFSHGQGGAANGGGVVLSHSVNYAPGTPLVTNNDLDMAVEGQGMFVLRDPAGKLIYTQAGRFEFDSEGVLVASGTKNKVLGLDAGGALAEITKSGLAAANSKTSEKITFSNTLLTNTRLLSKTVTVYDSSGTSHSLTIELTSALRDADGAVIVPAPANTWSVVVKEGSTVVAAADGNVIRFGTGGKVEPNGGTTDKTTLTFNFLPSNASPVSLVLDFSKTTSGSTGTSLVAVADGYARGTVTGTTVSDDGALAIRFSNGQEDKRQRIALALDRSGTLRTRDGVTFSSERPGAIEYGTSGDSFGVVKGGTLTGSNTDLTTAFSDLIVAQRMYGSGANVNKVVGEMLDALMQMNR
ncbi:flagellar hook-basal body complex protein [Massilia endophytica]|uniref:flagellar hook-basal body complex protein n=1 Tax=Massilia endophytica TaxID=2899220 RepID=UPI001E4BFF84|nr:flagellar hook-basal body complex protein [Massilia endophytica]UGQ47974.1 flagellar hook-basal body complex protein [Massilia endophytica]